MSGEENQAKRLAGMGLFRNARVAIASSGSSGLVLTLSGTSRLALDRKLAGEIWVECA